MPLTGKPKARVWQGWFPLALAAAFGVAHTQAPLYFSNQNQYLLHGAAQAGVGYLDEDWLANTQDPTPVFSGLVAVTYRWPGESFFHVEFFLLLVVYFCSLAALPATLTGAPLTGCARFGYYTLLVGLHAGAVRLASVRLFGVDYPWYFQCGIANQYVLGPSLQPSVFGLLLITSLVTFARGYPAWAALCSSAAALFHPTYLLSAGLLTLAYVMILARAGRWRAALAMGAGSLGAVLPVLIYSVRAFGPTSPEQFAEAQLILAEIRIPHHANVQQWLDGIAIGQLCWIALAMLLVRRSALFPLMVVPALGGLVLTAVQVVTGSNTLALLFPWRVSAMLMPLATAVILAWSTTAAGSWIARRTPLLRGLGWACLFGLLVAAVVGGGVVMWQSLGYLSDDEELPMMEYAREHRRPGLVYLLPVRIPAVGLTRGSVSTSFTKPQRAAKVATLIPVDLQRFRLLSQTPIYVDFKSVPYKDVDVLEWYRRMQLCQQWFERKDWDDAESWKVLTREGITHVVTPASKALKSQAVELIYSDNRYRIYQLKERPR